MEYHPGGIEELMRGAGIDGTQLFDEVCVLISLLYKIFKSLKSHCVLVCVYVFTCILDWNFSHIMGFI